MKRNGTIFALCALAFLVSGCNNPSPAPASSSEEVFNPTTYRSNGVDIAEYKIVKAKKTNDALNFAATELQSYINKATGVTLDIVTDDTSENAHEILLGNVDRPEVAGIDFATLGDESYQIKNVGTDLVIAANAEKRGILYGVYSFLEALGYRFFTKDCERTPDEDKVFVPQSIDLSWSPTFTYRETMFYSAWDAGFAVKNKINGDFLRSSLKNFPKYGGSSGYIGGSRYLVHTLKYLLDPNTYLSAHPEYYARNEKGAQMDKNLTYLQPCFSNYDTCDIVYDACVALINADGGDTISISQNDGGSACQCSDCKANYEKYGETGTMLLWVNKVADRLAVSHPNVKVDTLSYSFTGPAPKGGVKASDNVVVRFCTSSCPFHRTETRCENNLKYENRFLEWQGFAKEFSVWTYPTDYGSYFNAWPNYFELKDNLRFFADHGVTGVYHEGFHTESAEFAELKAYVLSKASANPYMSDAEYEYHIRDFLKGYYGEGWTYIRKYIKDAHDAIVANMGNRCKSPIVPVTDLFDFKWDYETKKYDYTLINKFNGYWEAALDACETQSEKDHVTKSSCHWTYIELYATFENRCLYGTKDIADELILRNEQLYRNLMKFNAITIYNGKTISKNITDFTQSPEYWS